MEIRGWDNESCRSVANVSWTTGSTNVYRLGHKGNVDLKYTSPAPGGYYYKDHMPVLGQRDEQQPVVQATRPTFFVGDRVRVCLDKDSLMRLQQGHGGWNPRMAEFLSKIGTVHRITDKGDIRVQYEGCSNRWTFHPAALVKVFSFHIGDLVTILSDASKIQQFQKGHGEWVETMRNALGKTCKVMKIYADGDLRVTQLDDGVAWTLNPKCVKLERSPMASAAERSNSMMDLSHQRTDHVLMPLQGLSGTSAADKLVREAAQGKLDYVQHYLGANLDQVDVMSGGKTCLQVAAHQGHQALVEYLLSIGANVNIVDKEGDSVLHYAAFGNQPDIMRILLQHGANINVLNASHCTALHISAHKKPPHCVRVLLEFTADVNLQDSYGDTALHDAIGKENTEVVELLCNVPTLDLAIRNKRGFNCLHHASLKGNVVAARRILQLARQLVDVKKDDGFSALHLAALNGHSHVCEVLVMEGQAEIDIRNDRRQTPFLLAVSQGHASAIEKLVDLKCDILAKDEDGDNAMHLTIIKKANLVQEVPQQEAPKIYEIYQQLGHVQEHRLMYTLLCYLAQEGCKMDANYKGARIFDWIPEPEIRELILNYEQKRVPPANASGSNDVNQPKELTELYNNIEMMNLTSQDSTTLSTEQDNSGGSSSMANFNASSNPPTPARRNRGTTNNNNRDVPTPPPANFSSLSAEDEKKLNTNLPRNHTISPPLPHASNEPTTSSSTSVINTNLTIDASNSPNRNSSQSPPLPTSSKHISRKQHIPQKVHMAPQPPPPFNVKPQLQAPQECVVCNEICLMITFEPCYHQVCCEDCGLRMKKCLTCHAIIDKRIAMNGKILFPKETPRQPSADRLRYLETKILEIEETHCCSICMERRRNVAFLCGHSACSKCAETLKTCHM